MCSALGRFISADSIIPEASQGVQAWDRYAGMNNNAVRYSDPSGHCAQGGDDWCFEEKPKPQPVNPTSWKWNPYKPYRPELYGTTYAQPINNIGDKYNTYNEKTNQDTAYLADRASDALTIYPVVTQGLKGVTPGTPGTVATAILSGASQWLRDEGLPLTTTQRVERSTLTSAEGVSTNTLSTGLGRITFYAAVTTVTGPIGFTLGVAGFVGTYILSSRTMTASINNEKIFNNLGLNP